MKTSSAKAKGRRCAQYAKDRLLAHAPLDDADIRVTPAGVTGPDLQLSPLAKRYYPFAFEMKNTESLNVWKALKQAEDHVEAGDTPALVFKRNRSEVYIAMKLEDFLTLYRGPDGKEATD